MSGDDEKHEVWPDEPHRKSYDALVAERDEYERQYRHALGQIGALTAKRGAIADEIVADLFVNGVGEEAARLVLTSADGRDLGGWCKQAVHDRITAALRSAPAPTGGPDGAACDHYWTSWDFSGTRRCKRCQAAQVRTIERGFTTIAPSPENKP